MARPIIIGSLDLMKQDESFFHTSASATYGTIRYYNSTRATATETAPPRPACRRWSACGAPGRWRRCGGGAPPAAARRPPPAARRRTPCMPHALAPKKLLTFGGARSVGRRPAQGGEQARRQELGSSLHTHQGTDRQAVQGAVGCIASTGGQLPTEGLDGRGGQKAAGGVRQIRR